MAFCSSCGARVEQGARFCPECGAPLAASVQSASQPAQPIQPIDQPVQPIQPIDQPVQPIRPIDQPVQPIQPIDQPVQPIPPIDQPVQPIQPIDQPAQPIQPIDQPVQPIRPLNQPVQPIQPIDQPAQPIRPIDQSAQPIQPIDQPAQPIRPINQPVQPIQPINQPVQPKEKKPGNKKLLIIIIIAVVVIIGVVVALILLLGGKGGTTANDPNLGVYTATSAEIWDMETPVSDLYKSGVIIELQAGGKCVINVDGTKGSGTWTLTDGVFHLNGGGLDCDGTLANGMITLENMFDLGLNMVFTKDGVTPVPPSSTSGATDGAGSDQTALQSQWNGVWYGVMNVRESTGEFESISSTTYDAYMTVDVDENGAGTFAVYIAGSSKAFAYASCDATENELKASSGSVCDFFMQESSWIFVPSSDYPDQVCMSDDMLTEGGDFLYSLNFKKWGASWQTEIDSGSAIVPPGVDEYNRKVENGETPPYVNAAPDTSGDPENTDVSPLSGPTATYNYWDQFYLTFPTDTWYQAEGGTFDTLEARDESARIEISVRYSEENFTYSDEYFDSFKNYEGFSDIDVTVAGFSARRISFYDDSETNCYRAFYNVDFGGNESGNYGVVFYVSSPESLENCVSGEVMAILNTIAFSDPTL